MLFHKMTSNVVYKTLFQKCQYKPNQWTLNEFALLSYLYTVPVARSKSMAKYFSRPISPLIYNAHLFAADKTKAWLQRPLCKTIITVVWRLQKREFWIRLNNVWTRSARGLAQVMSDEDLTTFEDVERETNNQNIRIDSYTLHAPASCKLLFIMT